jgi:hypothetical protein
VVRSLLVRQYLVALAATRAGNVRDIVSLEAAVVPTVEDELGPCRPVHGRMPLEIAVTVRVDPFLCLG